jgi:MFS family permease
MMRLNTNFLSKRAFLKGNFLILIITWILMCATQPIPSTYESLYFLSLGANTFLLSVIGFVGSLTTAFMQVPGGYLADQHGRRWLIVTMTFGLAAGYVFFMLAPSWHFIVLGMILQSLCLIYQPALLAMLLDSVKPEKRGIGFNFQSVLLNFVALPAPLIAAALVLVNGEYVSPQSDLGMRVAYTIVFAAYVAAAVLRLKLKETIPVKKGDNRPRILQAFREYPRCFRECWHVWRQVPKSAYYLFVSMVSINGVVAGCQIFFVVYAKEVLGITGLQWAIVMAFMYLSIALPALFAGFRMDATGRKRFLVLGFLLYVPAMLLFVNGNFTLLLIAFFLCGLGNMLRVNSSQALLGDLIPRDVRGKAAGFLQFVLFFTQAFVYLLIGFLYSYVAPQLPFVLLAVVAVPLTLLVIFRISEPKVKEV